MNIYNHRIKNFLNGYIKESLSRGYMPTASEMIIAITQYRLSLKEGKPTFSSPIKNSISVADWNIAKKQIEEDLSIIAEAIKAIAEETEIINIYKEIQEEEVNNKIKNLQKKIESVLIRSDSKNKDYSIIEDFNDLNNIDQETTTAEIDVINGEAYNKKLSTSIIQSWDYSIQANDKIDSITSIDSLYDSSQIWKCVISKIQQAEASVSIEIKLKERKTVSEIYISSLMLKPCAFSIQTSTEGTYKTIKNGELINNYRVSIGEPIDKIKIILSKKEADKFNEKYLYYFILKNIFIYETHYSRHSLIETKTIELPKTLFSSVFLEAEEEIPSGTQINYSLLINNEKIDLIPSYRDTFRGASPLFGKNMMEIETIIQPEGISNKALYRPHLSVGEQKAYEIFSGNIPEKIELIKGIYSWKKEKINIFDTIEPNLQYFEKNKSLIETEYIPANINKPGYINDSMSASGAIKYTLFFNNNSEPYLLNKKIITNKNIILYVNKERVYVKDSSYTCKIKKGMNQINILASGSKDDIIIFDIGITNDDIPSIFFANEQKMKQVSLLEFQYSTTNRKDIFFTIKKDDISSIYVKDEDVSIIYGIEKPVIEDNNYSAKLKITMQNNGENKNITPKVKKIKINFKG